MLGEDISKGRNSPHSDTKDLKPEIENLKPTQKKAKDLLLNSILCTRKANVVISVSCEKELLCAVQVHDIHGVV